MKMRWFVVLFLVAAGHILAAWQGAKTIVAPDSATPYMFAYATATDRFGSPWAIWSRWWYSHADQYFQMSRWNGTGWDEPARLPDTISRTQLGSYVDFTFDSGGRLVMVWPNEDNAEQCDIYSARYDPVARAWELPRQVNDKDTVRLDDYYPRISQGGGQVWATWFKENGGSAVRCDVKANHWDSGSQYWEPDMTVNPDTGGVNRTEWFPDIAVDTTGMPHIVWNGSALFYSRYEDGHWLQPETLTNPDSVLPSGPYGGTRPRLVTDIENNLHCAFIGYRIRDSMMGIYYCKYTAATGWSQPVRIDTWSTRQDPNWDKDIAVDRPDNIWVVYDQGNSSELRIYAQHFDGSGWSGPERIDDGVTHYGGFPKVSLDGNGDPVVIWSADSGGTGQYAIWFNHFSSASVAESRAGVPALALQLSVSPNPFRDHVSLQLTAYGSRPEVRIYDISGQLVRDFPVRQAAGGTRQAVVSWDGTDALGRKLANGVYLARLETGDGTTVTKQVLLLRR